MKRKLLRPLICKKRSKKRKIIIYEYENNISNLMRKLKIEDDENKSCSSGDTMPPSIQPFESSMLLSCNSNSYDNESSSSDETMPPNIQAFESSMRNKLLRCNLKTYSSYSSSKNINVYKKAESKCIRLISVSTYLQGKVLSTHNSSKLPARKFYPLYGIKNKTIVAAPKPLLNITNYLKQFDSRLTQGKFGSILNFNPKCTEVYKNVNSVRLESLMYGKDFILSFRQMQSFTLRKFKELMAPKYLTKTSLNRKITLLSEGFLPNSSRSESVLCSNIKRSFDIFGEACKSIATGEGNISNICIGDETCARKTPNTSMDAIKQTIMELMHLGLEIEIYTSVLKMFNYASPSIPSIHDICKLKIKFADLVKECKYLQAKKRELNSEQCSENICLNKEGKIDSIYDSFGERGASNNLEKTVNISYFAQQSCKRSKMEDEKNSVILKRSKILDECISRVNFVENFYVKHENVPAIRSEDIEGNNLHRAYEDKHHDEAKMFNVISDSDSLAESIKTAFSSDNISNEEEHQTTFKLPSFRETFKDIQKVNRKVPDSGNSSSTIFYDTEDGRKLVIFPYTNIYY